MKSRDPPVVLDFRALSRAGALLLEELRRKCPPSPARGLCRRPQGRCLARARTKVAQATQPDLGLFPSGTTLRAGRLPGRGPRGSKEGCDTGTRACLSSRVFPLDCVRHFELELPFLCSQVVRGLTASMEDTSPTPCCSQPGHEAGVGLWSRSRESPLPGRRPPSRPTVQGPGVQRRLPQGLRSPAQWAAPSARVQQPHLAQLVQVTALRDSTFELVTPDRQQRGSQRPGMTKGKEQFGHRKIKRVIFLQK